MLLQEHGYQRQFEFVLKIGNVVLYFDYVFDCWRSFVFEHKSSLIGSDTCFDNLSLQFNLENSSKAV